MSIHLKQTLLDFSYLGKFHSNISFLVFKIVFKTQRTQLHANDFCQQWLRDKGQVMTIKT